MTLYLEKIECSQRPQANHLFSSSFIDFVRFMLRRCQVGFNGIWSFDSPKSPFWQKVCTTTKEPLTMCRAQTITFIWLFFSMCQTQNVLGGTHMLWVRVSKSSINHWNFPSLLLCLNKTRQGVWRTKLNTSQKMIIKFQSSKYLSNNNNGYELCKSISQ